MSDIAYSRACNRCRLVKPLDEFSRARQGKHGRKAGCKACDAARHVERFVSKRVDDETKRARWDERRAKPKLCPKCGLAKDRSEFPTLREGKHGRLARTVCKTCTPAEKRRYDLKWQYGVTVAEYDAMLAAQGGVCAICKRPERAKRDGKFLLMPVDHDHRTGQVRGILCHGCNRALGLLGDDPDRIRRVIQYLRDLPPGAAPGTR